MLVLASRSPRRHEILVAAGIDCEVRMADVPERRRPHESPEVYVRRLAREKAHAVPRSPAEIVLGADTVVVLDEDLLEKPGDPADARAMLALLSGRTHRVITGICLLHDIGSVVDAEETLVRFVSLSAREIDGYVASGESMDKAGAYGIQGLASKFIDRVEGCYFNVVGLPISTVYRHLSAIRNARLLPSDTSSGSIPQTPPERS